MIIRSGLIRNRDDVNFENFSDHWKHVHAPLALKVEAMRAYRQNHIVARVPQGGSQRLHRIDGISQLWFDDVESMRVAMESAEQRACVEDIRGFLDDVTIVIQAEGDTVSYGDKSALNAKQMYLLNGSRDSLESAVDVALTRHKDQRTRGLALRLNPVVNRDFSVDPTVPSGPQIIDGVLEIWIPKASAGEFLTFGGGTSVIDAFEVNEIVFK